MIDRTHVRTTFAVTLALICGVLATACIDRPLAPSAAGSDAVSMNLVWTISKQLSTATRSIEVQVGYDLPGGAFVKLADDSFPVALSSLQLPVTVDLSSCLADPNRGTTSNVCPLVAFVSLKDATGTTIATASGGPINATPGTVLTALTVAVDGVRAVSVTPLAPSLPVGATTQLSATEADSAGTVLAGRAVTWTSTNPGVGTVSATGLVTATGLGVDTIKATSEGQIGIASVTTTVRYVSISLGRDHTCGLTNGGILYCWGLSRYGQLGVGAVNLLPGNDSAFLPTPSAVAGGHAFVQTTAGDHYHCALTSGGAAFCWGLNSQGQLGTGDTLARSVPTAVVGGITFASLSGGGLGVVGSPEGATSGGTSGTCGLTSPGAAYCWGYIVPNTTSGTLDSSLTALPVPGGLSFTQLTSGRLHTCGLATAGAAYCWGSNANGQFGNGTSTSSGITPVLAAGGMVFKKVAAGDLYTCGLTPAGAAYCWGAGELGNGTTSPSLVPVAVSGGLAFTDINAGPDDGVGVCGIISGGAAYCWGGNTAGGLGDGTTTERLVPTAVTGGILFTQVIPSRFRHTCGISTSGTVYCWGYNSFGQLADGAADINIANTDSYVPVRVIWQP